MEQIIIGIDISSKTLDICVKKEQGSSHFAIANDMKSIRAFLKKQALSDAIVAMENTAVIPGTCSKYWPPSPFRFI